jgi:hypothetical protein
MKKGDRIEVVRTQGRRYFLAGDLATLTHQDADGDWWADFDVRHFHDLDNNFCLQEGITEYKLVGEDSSVSEDTPAVDSGFANGLLELWPTLKATTRADLLNGLDSAEPEVSCHIRAKLLGVFE